MTEQKRKVQLEAGLDATGVKRGAQEGKDAIRDFARDVQQSGAGAAKAFDGVGTGAEAATQKASTATRRLIDSIQRTTAAAESGGRQTAAYFEAIAGQRNLNTDALRPYIDRLKQVEQAQSGTSKAMSGTAISAGQMSAALRNVPAQFTDIAVSLQAGQAPLTVLLQQGGQLKDMFGGIGPAARAMGGYVVGLINPFTLAAAAALGLFAAFRSGSAEITKLQQANILAGQQLGVTAGQLQQVAANVAALGGGTQGQASEFLGEIARTGRVAAADLERFTDVALRMARAGGPAAQETAKAFAELGKEPLQASLKLTEQFNYLTAATYNQIKALEQQGRTSDAAALAQRAFFDAMQTRVPQMEASLGILERGWNGLTGAIRRAWDAAKDVGRADTLQQQAQALSDRIQAARTGIYSRDKVPDLLQQQAAVQELIRLDQRSADLSAQRAELTRTNAQWDKAGAEYRSKAARAEEEINKARIEGQKLVQAGLITEKDLNDRIAAIRAKTTDQPRASAARSTRPLINPADTEAMRAYAQGMDALQRITLDAAAGAEQLSKSQAKLREIQASPAWAQYSRQQQEQIINQAALGQAEEDRAASQKLLAQITREASRDYGQWVAEQQKGAEQAEQQAQRLRDEATAIGLVVPGYRSLEQAIILVDIARLRERQTAMLGNEDAVLAIQREIDARQQLVDLIGQAERRATAETEAKRFAEERQREQEKIGDALTDALMSAFDKGKSFAQSFKDTVVNTFKTLVLKPIVQAIVTPVAGVLGVALGFAGAANASNGGAAQTAGVMDSASQMFAKLQGGFGKIGDSVSRTAEQLGNWLVTNTTGTLNQAGAAIKQYASSIGAGAEVVAGAMAGMALRRAVGGKFEIDKGYSAFQDVGVAVASAIGGPVMGAIAGAVAGLVNRAFGTMPKQTYQQGIEGSFGGGDASGQNFADWIKKGGWFRSNKRGTENSPLNDEMGAALDAGAVAVYSQTRAWAQALQLPADVLAGVTSDFRVTFTEDAEANKKAVSDAIVAYGAALSSSFKRVLTPFQRAGEELQDTLGRLANLQVFSEGLNQLGGVFSRVAGLSVDIREEFIGMAGGMQNLAGLAKQFAQDFFDRDEIAGVKAAELQTVLAAVGVDPSTIKSRDDYRALVESADINTVSGREQLAALLQASSAFTSVADYMAETGATLAQVANQAPAGGALANILNPSSDDLAAIQVDATHGVTAAVNTVAAKIDELAKVLRDQQEQIFLWTQEVGGGA